MVKIIVPENIHVDFVENGINKQQDLQFSQFVLNIPLKHSAFGQEYLSLKCLERLLAGAKDLKPGDVWELNEEDFNALKTTTSKPEKPYDLATGLKVLPFFDAIMLAK